MQQPLRSSGFRAAGLRASELESCAASNLSGMPSWQRRQQTQHRLHLTTNGKWMTLHCAVLL